MREAAVVLDRTETPLYWHAPDGRTSAFIPDSHDLWALLWANRERVFAVAHTHPRGHLKPSSEDHSTFAAVEAGLGRRLVWWIVTQERSAAYLFAHSTGSYRQVELPLSDDLGRSWMTSLRALSFDGVFPTLENSLEV